ncbi:MAG: hypothetical protein EBZ58_07640 [Bacteroidetes bacterium]|jgi:hypothetical protein|nr:hypothetical protein [Bacteroidota bacterium]
MKSNRVFLLLILLLNVSILYCQKVGLKKNGTERIYHFRLPKFITLDYQTDSGLLHIEAKAIKYDFPLMTIMEHKKTINIDVRKIYKLEYNSRISGLYYIGSITTSIITLSIIPPLFFSRNSLEDSFGIIILACIPASLSYLQLYEADRKFNTKNKWSFVNPKENN